MSGSSKQLTLFDCANAKRAKLTPEELSPKVSSSNKVCEDYSSDEDCEEGIHLEMPSTPSPCCTPHAIYDSSGSIDAESVQAGFCTDDDDSHLLIDVDAPFQTEFGSSISSTVAVTGSTVIPSSLVSSIASSTGTASNMLCTNSSNTVLPGPISYRGTSSSGSGHGLPKDIAQSPCFPPAQPIKTRYPSTMFSNVSRCFSPAWYKSFQWLEYSVEKDACFCYPCRLFGSVSAIGSSRPETAFTLIGFKDWKHATGKKGILICHCNSLSHKESMVAWEQYRVNSERGSSISNRINSSWETTIANNRHYIKTISEILLFCSRQEIGIRGHREDKSSMNRGNILELLDLVAKHDTIIQHKITNTPQNATYTSPQIQNDLLHIMASIVQSRISTDVIKAGIYSILADESKDCSKREQLAIVLRYVDLESAIIHERFLTYVEAKRMDAEALATYIINTLQQHGLDPSKIVSQGYDGASVMSGHCTGVQQRVKQVAPRALYVHCYAHCLNLVLVDTTKTVPQASEFFALMETLYVFISTSKAHTVYIQQQNVLHPDKPIHQLQKLSDTRWTCRFFAVEAVCSTFDAILATLQCLVEGDDKVKAVEAKGILLQIQCFKFLITLIMFWRILFLTKQLSDQLQSPRTDMAKAADLVTATMETLQQFRSDEEWSKLYKYVKDVASLHNIEIAPLRNTRSRTVPKRFADVIILETTGSREIATTNEDYKISLYFPVLDAMISELHSRFEDKNVQIMRAIQCCNPNSTHFLDVDFLVPLIEAYDLSKESLSAECLIAKRMLNGKDACSISDVLKEIIPLNIAFPTLIKVLQIALTIVVTTAECERSFSCLKRTKNYLRSSMSEQRLIDLAVLSIEQELSKELSLDDVVQKFAGEDKNRRIRLS